MNNNLKKRIYSILKNPRDPDTTTTTTTTTTSAADEEKTNIYGISDVNQYMEKLAGQMSANTNTDKLNTQIFGMPYQFLPTADKRFDAANERFGMGFFNNIYMEKPLVTLMPGKMLFLPSYSN